MTTITADHIEDDDDGMTFLGIVDMDDWAEFWEANGEEISEALECNEEIALRLAMNCGLIVGGGAAPMFRVGFVD